MASRLRIAKCGPAIPDDTLSGAVSGDCCDSPPRRWLSLRLHPWPGPSDERLGQAALGESDSGRELIVEDDCCFASHGLGTVELRLRGGTEAREVEQVANRGRTLTCECLGVSRADGGEQIGTTSGNGQLLRINVGRSFKPPYRPQFFNLQAAELQQFQTPREVTSRHFYQRQPRIPGTLIGPGGLCNRVCSTQRRDAARFSRTLASFLATIFAVAYFVLDFTYLSKVAGCLGT